MHNDFRFGVAMTDIPQFSVPLAERMRPSTLSEFTGQEHLTAPGKLLYHMIEQAELCSIILWGPPGTGKTTLAHIIATASGADFAALSAVTAGIKDVRQVIASAVERQTGKGRRTLLFIDEIHRFNKAQQDAFLPHVENGDIVLVGATTENPSFEVISPLLSRTKVLLLEQLCEADIVKILGNALADSKQGMGSFNVAADQEMLALIAQYSQGDARIALNTLELSVMLSEPDKAGERMLSRVSIENALQQKMLIYDKDGEQHYNLISALHKSLRGSDVDAALYWLARMLAGGEDPMFIARRLIRFASEDIGNADPRALQVALEAREAFHCIGHPEGDLALAQAVAYMATAPKSNALYKAWQKVSRIVAKTGSLPVPLHIRNAPTGLMRNLGYGKEYKYDHNYDDAIAHQDYLPEQIASEKFYQPSSRGYEKIITERMEYIARKKRER
jgi:putative ATPase